MLSPKVGVSLSRAESKPLVATIGDSTFLHGGIPALIDAVYNQSNITVPLLDNRTVAMTGGQASPTTSSDRYTTTTSFGNHEPRFDPCKLAEAAGASFVGREVTLQLPA